MKSGSVVVDCIHSHLTIPEHHFLLIPPQTEHYIVSTDGNPSFGSIRFTYSASSNDAIGASIDQVLGSCVFRPILATQDAARTFDQLRAEYRDYVAHRDRKLWLYPKLTAHCLYFISSILETASDAVAHPSAKFTGEKDLLPMIIEFFMLYTSESDVSVEDLAKSLSYSVSQTNRILQQNFGKSFRSMMNDIRIRKAKYYLLRTDFPIKKISEILGFNEPKNFNRSFKASVGVTPSAYRTKNFDTDF